LCLLAGSLVRILFARLRFAGSADGNPTYSVSWRVLNTIDYGVPHFRRRIWIVILRRDAVLQPFRWPCKVTPRPLACSVLDPVSPSDVNDKRGLQLAPKRRQVLKKAVKFIAKSGGRPWSQDYFIDVMSSPKFAKGGKRDYLPCLTRARGGTGWWISSRGRFTSLAELCRFQGFDPETFAQCTVSPRQLGLALGNGWSLNVATKVLQQALIACGMISS
jgi:site-specific DNA-cytosine methylase